MQNTSHLHINQPIDSKIVVALDYADSQSALALVNQLDPALCKLKIGKELFTAAGPQLVEAVAKKGFKVFLDLKFHDIPTTVAKACVAASNLGVWMLNVHASGGLEMMQAANEAVQKAPNKPILIAVTVLTSMDQAALSQIGITHNLADHVLTLAKLTKSAGLDGVVCSAQEAHTLRQALGADFCLVTPGIRLDTGNSSAVNQDDQSRVMTPQLALKNGASYLVIGRPITQAQNPQQTLENIYAECTQLMRQA
jgi:orotidine-5'-phosphate decarboxylase